MFASLLHMFALAKVEICQAFSGIRDSAAVLIEVLRNLELWCYNGRFLLM